MTDWAAFAGFTGVILAVLLALAHLSRGIPHADGGDPYFDRDADSRAAAVDDDSDADSSEARPVDSNTTHGEADGTHHDAPAPSGAPFPPMGEDSVPSPDIPPQMLLANVAVSQGLLGVFLVTSVWYTSVPVSALGLSFTGLPSKLALGVALGIALYAVNRAGTSVSREFGLVPDESLRETLTPETAAGWALLLFAVLPLIAGFEELLFRGALVGAISVGFDVSPWFMATLSSVAFGVGHGAQGRLGIVVTGLLGFVLAAAFVLTESLVVVVVAHYLVNALEFVCHHLFGW
ncbi:lysostaphin resistance A-like protein [Haloferax sp. S1W]|uniref:lysostaphin resistance A-like protein n=1 Tax=Haloferax sp. S1W TaxID=3377110 RepID=UPI0037C9EC2B